jgi:Ni,Fe-hydrogenase I cytochrome b subunit
MLHESATWFDGYGSVLLREDDTYDVLYDEMRITKFWHWVRSILRRVVLLSTEFFLVDDGQSKSAASD